MLFRFNRRKWIGNFERSLLIEKRKSFLDLRQPEISSTLIVLLAESPHLTRYRLLQLLYKF